jgi:diguanylate cyclase (GGDEF)-like protein
VLLAWAAWQPRPKPRLRPERLSLLGLPAAFGLVALGVLVVGGVARSGGPALWLAAAALLCVLVRLMLAFRENLALLAASRAEAARDVLTGLHNRRKLMEDLDAALAGERGRLLLVLLDLDGFKAYNDAYGHPAGDAVLARLGARLAAAAAPGTAYRLGGDEFCVLTDLDGREPEELAASLAAALVERYETVSITSSHGFAVLREEASERSEAMSLADRRLYACKAVRRRDPGSAPVGLEVDRAGDGLDGRPALHLEPVAPRPS